MYIHIYVVSAVLDRAVYYTRVSPSFFILIKHPHRGSSLKCLYIYSFGRSCAEGSHNFTYNIAFSIKIKYKYKYNYHDMTLLNEILLFIIYISYIFYRLKKKLLVHCKFNFYIIHGFMKCN